MKPALHETLSELIAAARRVQEVLDAERPGRLLEAAALCRLAGDLADMVHRLREHARTLGGREQQGD
jgi:hypothetical protein